MAHIGFSTYMYNVVAPIGTLRVYLSTYYMYVHSVSLAFCFVAFQFHCRGFNYYAKCGI